MAGGSSGSRRAPHDRVVKGRRVFVLAVVATMVIGAGAWFVSRSEASRVEVVDLSDSPKSVEAVTEDPGTLGPYVELAELSAGVPEASKLCQDGSATSGDEPCRITAALAKPPHKDPESLSTLAPIDGRRPGSFGTPAIADAADPTVLVDGQTYYVFTTSAQWLRAPVMIVPAADLLQNGDSLAIVSQQPSPFGDGEMVSTTDPEAVVRREAMPDRIPWSSNNEIWAPSVSRFDGKYVMHFAAKRIAPPDPANQECIGRAVASHPAGPYVADETPITCGLGGRHGALDPSVVRDHSSGRAFLLAAFGGSSTTLWSIPLTEAGLAGGPAVPLLSLQQPWETWFLENPSMVFNGVDYTLAYSAGRWYLESYSTGLARCATPVGPCVSDRRGPWLATIGAVSGPGGLDFFTAIDGSLMAIHHGYPGAVGAVGARAAFIRRVQLDERSVGFR